MKSQSKFISFVLRHQPEAIDLDIDKNGWVSIDQLIANAKAAGTMLTREIIQDVVDNNDKGRFALSEDGKKIRALQGHSISKDRVSIEFEAKTPPEVLYHGTATRFVDSIKETGLKSFKRQYVHLSWNEDIATSVGQRHGTPVILEIDTQAMLDKGHVFYLSENNVWLTENVPAEFITVKKEQSYKPKFK